MPTWLTSDGSASMCHSLPWRTERGHLEQVLAGSPVNRGVQTTETLIRQAKGIAPGDAGAVYSKWNYA